MGQMEAEERDSAERAYYASLEFVRYGQPGDAQYNADPGGSLWRDAHGDDVWLRPMHVQQYGLAGKMREGLARGQGGTPPLDPEPARPKLGDLKGGHTDAWRWDFVQDGDEITVCLDNRPAIDAACEAGTGTPENPLHIPQLEQVRVPADVVQAIASMLQS